MVTILLLSFGGDAFTRQVCASVN